MQSTLKGRVFTKPEFEELLENEFIKNKEDKFGFWCVVSKYENKLIDVSGNIYLTALETNSVSVVLSKDKSVKTIVQDENMNWPDGVSYNNVDGYMYVSAAQVNRGAVFNNGQSKATKPFYIFRFKPLTPGVPFR